MFHDDQEYHRRRCEMELESAISAEDEESAVAHLTLARLHRAKRGILAQKTLDEFRNRTGRPIVRADKEA